MASPTEAQPSPANRRYQMVMERALAARDTNDMQRYSQLINEAEVLLRHIRQASQPCVEVPHALRTTH